MRGKAKTVIGVLVILLVYGAAAVPTWLGYGLYHRIGLNRDLIEAVKCKDADEVRWLLCEGVSSNVTTVPVKYESFWQCIRAEVKVILHRPVTIAHLGDSALAIAVRQNDKEIVSLLLADGASGVNYELYRYTERYGGVQPVRCSLLCIAARNGSATIVRCLIKHGANVNKVDDERETPLHFACVSGDTRTVKLLLDAGAAKEAKDIDGETPLLSAAEYDRKDVVRLLLHYGANVNAEDGLGWTPLSLASLHATNLRINYLMLHNASEGPVGSTTLAVLPTARADTAGVVKSLLDASANPNLSDGDAETPLMFAAENGDSNAIRELLNAGAHVNDRTEAGHSATDIAEHEQHWDAVKLLKRYGGTTTGTEFSPEASY